MGHVGLTPQTSTALGGYKAQGRSAAAANRIAREALALQEAGCFSLVFEAIPSAVAEELMPHLQVPVIGIGAGPAVDGQVLVFHDLLGIREGLGARFVKRYANLLDEMVAGVAAYARRRARPDATPGPSTATRSTSRAAELARRCRADAGSRTVARPGRIARAGRGSTLDPARRAQPELDLAQHLRRAPQPRSCRPGGRVVTTLLAPIDAAVADRHAAGDDDVRAEPDVVAEPRRALRSRSPARSPASSGSSKRWLPSVIMQPLAAMQ